MTLQETLFNWLQIRTVSIARPEDNAAKETCEFFEQILSEDHKLTYFEVTRTDETMYHIQYELEGKKKTQMFQKELVDKLLEDINSNPKYNE
ncbi:MAG TPA: hypothetical protein VGE40_04105 [Bacilli bacterium]